MQKFSSINYTELFNHFIEIKYLKKAVKEQEIILGKQRKLHKKDHPDIASCLNTLGLLYQALSKINNLEHFSFFYNHRLEWVINGCYEYPEDVLNKEELIQIYQDKSYLHKAEKYFEEAYETRKNIYKIDHPELATSLYNLGIFKFVYSNRFLSHELLEEAYEMRKRIYKIDHPELVESLHSLVFTKNASYDREAALELYKESCKMRKRIYKGDSLEDAKNLNNTALLFQFKDDYGIAQLFFQESINIRKRIYKSEHKDIADVIYNLAYYNFTFSKPLTVKQLFEDESVSEEPLFKLSLDIRKKNYNEDHADIARCIFGLALIYKKEYYKKDEAKNLLIEALEMRQKIYNGQHPEIVSCLYQLADYYNEIKKIKEAENYYKEALNQANRVLKGNDFFKSCILFDYGYFYYSQNRLEDAIPLLEESLKIKMKLFQKNSDMVLVQNLGILADTYSQLGELNKAESLLKEQLIKISNLVNNNDTDIGGAKFGLAEILNKQNKLKEALPLYIDALDSFSREIGYDKEDIQLMDMLNKITDIFKNMKNQENGIYNFLESLKEAESIEDRGVINTRGMINASIIRLVDIYIDFDKKNIAIQILKDIYNSRTKQNKIFNQNISIITTKLAELYKEIGKFKEAELILKS